MDRSFRQRKALWLPHPPPSFLSPFVPYSRKPPLVQSLQDNCVFSALFQRGNSGKKKKRIKQLMWKLFTHFIYGWHSCVKTKGQVIVHCQVSKETDYISLHSSEIPFPKLFFSKLQEWEWSKPAQFIDVLTTGVQWNELQDLWGKKEVQSL